MIHLSKARLESNNLWKVKYTLENRIEDDECASRVQDKQKVWHREKSCLNGRNSESIYFMYESMLIQINVFVHK